MELGNEDGAHLDMERNRVNFDSWSMLPQNENMPPIIPIEKDQLKVEDAGKNKLQMNI